MDYPATLEFLYQQLPIFQRVGKAAYKADLGNTIALSAFFKEPHEHFRSIHIAGTNGKGSTAHMLASVLQEAGYKTGLYTSPHLKDFRERIKINGEMIPENEVAAFVEQSMPVIEQVQPSFFELTMMMAFEHFRQEKVDIAVIETGMGGRLDSTNIITPEVSIITNIGMDHTSFLGNDLLSIAVEKAGIIKQNVPIVIGRAEGELKHYFETKAAELSAQIVFAQSKPQLDIECDLKGSKQKENIATSLAALALIKPKFSNISQNSIVAGLHSVIQNTGLQGRWQRLQENPLVITDIAHNQESIGALLENLQQTPFGHLHIVLGMVNDKEIDALLQMLPETANYYFCKANIPRGMEANLLASKANEHKLEGNTYPSVETAFSAAKESANAGDLVLITGSAFVVAEVL